MNTAEFNVRISVWSLANSSGITAALRGPKHADRGIDFSRDGRFLAVAERENCKDYVQIYRCGNWSPVKRFAVDTKDLADLKWSPDDRTISIWDSVSFLRFKDTFFECVPGHHPAFFIAAYSIHGKVSHDPNNFSLNQRCG